MEKMPLVGIGVFILKGNKILLGKRKNAHGEGSWSLPGGHLEFGESWEACAQRETDEETGIKIKSIKFFTASNDVFNSENKHYVTIFMIAQYESGEIMLKEPEKCECWDWFEWDGDTLPRPLFLPLENLISREFPLLQTVTIPELT